MRAPKSLLLSALFCGLFSTGLRAQPKATIDSSNYYAHLSQGEHIVARTISTDWLRENDAIPILEEELEHAGYKQVERQQLYQLPDGRMIVLSAYAGKPEIGFLYIGGHAADPEPAHRTAAYWNEEAKDQGWIYAQYFRKDHGALGYTPFSELPPWIIVLHEDCYWFQYTDKPVDNKHLVTKPIAIQILRQDIRTRLAAMKGR